MAKRTAKPKPKRKANAAKKKKVAVPDANELQHWRFMAVPASTTPDALSDRSIAGALDDLVAADVDDHAGEGDPLRGLFGEGQRAGDLARLDYVALVIGACLLVREWPRSGQDVR